VKADREQALQDAWTEFLVVMGLKESEMTLGERLLFSVAFERGRKAERSQHERRLASVPRTTGERAN
jgi:hypothetical protein